MFQTVDVLGQKVDVLVVDVLEVDVLEVDQMGRPNILIKSFSFQFCFLVIRNSVSFDPFFIYLEQCFPNFLSLRTKARRRGLVVKEKTHVQGWSLRTVGL